MIISSDKSSAVNGKNDFLKLVAMLSMVVDHVGLVFFPQIVALRIVGRIAFPIFASGIADGYRYTSNLKMYLFRLLFFGVISQVPYMIMAGKYDLNILFSFALSLLFIFALDKKKYWLGLSVLLFIFFIKCDYGFLAKFERSIDALRLGEIGIYNLIADEIGIAKIHETANADVMTTANYRDLIPQYRELARTQPTQEK